jgi:hypothetical protein
LWHVARWADRHQAGLSDRSGAADRSRALANERWVRENLASEWRLDPVRLGVFETGAAMDSQAASLISQVAKERVLAYAQPVFSDFDRLIEQINDDDLLLPVKATINISFEAGVPDSLTVLPVSDSRILDELLFHEGHAARHLGMIEALRGLVMEHGTATV